MRYSPHPHDRVVQAVGRADIAGRTDIGAVASRSGPAFAGSLRAPIARSVVPPVRRRAVHRRSPIYVVLDGFRGTPERHDRVADEFIDRGLSPR